MTIDLSDMVVVQCVYIYMYVYILCMSVCIIVYIILNAFSLKYI
jgi:hypothetical protein